MENLRRLVRPEQMIASKLLNPTVEAGAYNIVPLPFANLRPLHPFIWEYRWTGKMPEAPDISLDELLAWIKTDDFEHMFPAGITFEAAQQIVRYHKEYLEETNSEQRKTIIRKLSNLLHQRGVVILEERKKLVRLVNSQAEVEALHELARQTKDHVGFWQWMLDNTGVINAMAGATEPNSGLPGDILDRLRDVLLRCPGFRDNTLNAIFVDQRLSPWQYKLPESNNRYGRVNVTIEFLYNQTNHKQENGLSASASSVLRDHARSPQCHSPGINRPHP